jgi:diketogulonate reductase-like aldo/keto reductase
MRSRQPRNPGDEPENCDPDDEANKGNKRIKTHVTCCCCILPLPLLLSTLVFCIILVGVKTHLKLQMNDSSKMVVPTIKLPPPPPPPKMAEMGSIIYGAKSKGEDTARLVKEAIQAGFRHIATGGFHNEYNETGVGVGWKASGVPRNELFLQTLFLERTVNGYGTQNCNLEDDLCPPSSDLSLEYQVHLSIRSSLHNLQTDYLDAVLIHNFRAKLQPYEETIQAWRVLETYVDRGVIRHLGIVSVHDKEFLTKLHADARRKPSIIQNRFHSNRGYDISLRPLFKELGMANQLFWILTGSAGGKVRNNDVVKALAEKKGVSPQVLLYSFCMEIGGSPLIGSKSITHLSEDVDSLVNSKLKWEKEELLTMAGVINKKLIE